MHEEEVLRVILGTFNLRNTGSHRHSGNACGTDKRVHRVLRRALVHDLCEEQTAESGEAKGNHTHSDNHESLRLEEDVSRHRETHGRAEEDRHNVHEFVRRSLHEAFNDTCFLEDVAHHKHDDKGRSIRHDEHANDHHHHGKHDAFGLGNLAESLHANLAFSVVRHSAHDRRLDERHESHVGVSGNGDGADEVLSKLVRSEDGCRTVSTTDDTDGSCFAERKATESDSCKHGHEHAKLCATTEDERTRISDKRSKVRHGTHAQEDDGREEFQMDTLADVVVETASRAEHTFDAPATVVERDGRDVHRKCTDSNRQEQKRLVFFDNRKEHQHEAHDPHDYHREGNLRESCARGEVRD